VRSVRPEAPPDVLEASGGLAFRGMILIYLLLGQDQFSEYDAHYFPERAIRITRLSEPKNYSLTNTPGRTVLCAELPCIAACSTKALLPIADPTKVRMGLAVVSRDDCTAGQGCQSCVARCPVEALSIVECDDPYLVVEQGKCVGCGICEETCSTVNDQIAITVISGRTSKDSPHSDPRPAARPT